MNAPAEQTELVPTWTEIDLRRLRQLVKAEEASAWEIGDQLLRLLPVGPVGVKTGVKAAVKRLAAEIDAEPQHLTQCRLVAHGWPDGTRVPSATWAAHRAYMGPPQTAAERAETLRSLPRNEHGKITVQAVKDLTKGGGAGKPGWHELLGRVSETLTKAEKQLDQFEDATDGRKLNERLRTKAGRYALQAERLAVRLRDVAGDVPPIVDDDEAEDVAY